MEQKQAGFKPNDMDGSTDGGNIRRLRETVTKALHDIDEMAYKIKLLTEKSDELEKIVRVLNERRSKDGE